MPEADELQQLRFLKALSADLDGMTDPDRVLRHAIRRARDFFGAEDACIAMRMPGRETPLIRPAGAEASYDWPMSLLSDFIHERRTRVPLEMALARVPRHDRPWAALAIRRPQKPFELGSAAALADVAVMAARQVEAIDLRRLIVSRTTVDRKIMGQLRPRDLFYQILHALRDMTEYDHSSALLVADTDGDELELAAEQIAWQKGRSHRIGKRLTLPAAARAAMERGGVHGFDWVDGAWRPWPGASADSVVLAALLDYDRSAGPVDSAATEANQPESAPEPAQLLCAPLATRDGVIGAIKVAGLHPGIFGPRQRDMLTHFTSLASVAIQYLHRTEALHDRLIESEKKNALAAIARGVSHDVNGALGAVLPLVQQLRADLESGGAFLDGLHADLHQIEESLQFCRHIFRGLLEFAASAVGKGQGGNVRRAIDGTLRILGAGMARQGIIVDVDVSGDLPLVRAGQGSLEQLLLNLAANARDAMASGGKLAIRAAIADAGVEVLVHDTGCGVQEDQLLRIFEPFYTTKSDGTGLGLSICRSIVSEIGGELRLESLPGQGTCARVLLPMAMTS